MGPVLEVALVNCPLPEASFADVLNALGATGVKFLTFRDGVTVVEGAALAPAHLSNLTDIVHLGLMRNAIPQLDQTFFGPDLGVSLVSLDLTGNKGIKLHVNAFSGLTGLKELKLIDCDLTSLSDGLLDPLGNLEILNLYSNALLELPAGIFRNLTRLKTLTLRNNRFEGFPPGLLTPLIMLEELELGYSKFRSLPPRMLSGNTNLKRFEFLVNGLFCPPQRPGCEAAAIKLNLTGSLFGNPNVEVVKLLHVPLTGELQASLFRGCFNLRNVTIQSAYIERLSIGLFAETPLLELLDLAGNRLTSITAGTLNGRNKLKTLRLLANRIATIEPTAFNGLVGLEVLHLHQNQLTDISGDLLCDLTGLETLYLQQNQIRKIQRTALATNGKLRHLDLAFNNISVSKGSNNGFLSGQVFGSLETLNLTHNNISYLEESLIINFLNLRTLNLSHNAFVAVDPLDLAFSKNGKLTLDLSYNNISSFSLEATPEALFVFNTSYPYSLMLAGNPLRCDCYMSELRQKVTNELVSVISDKIHLADGNQLRCATGDAGNIQQLAGRLLSAVRYKELVCSFPSPVMKDPCPDTCSCTFNRYYDEVTLNCSGRGMTAFPSVLPARPSSSIWLHMENNSIADLGAAVRHFINRTETNYGNVRYLFLSHNKISKFRQVGYDTVGQYLGRYRRLK